MFSKYWGIIIKQLFLPDQLFHRLFFVITGPGSWSYGIHWLLLCRGVSPPPHECPGYGTKQSDREAPVMVELWGIRCTPSLSSPPGSLWPGVVAPDRVLFMGQIELNCVLMLNLIAWNITVFTSKLRTSAKLNCLKWNCCCMLNWTVWNWTILKFNCV